METRGPPPTPSTIYCRLTVHNCDRRKCYAREHENIRMRVTKITEFTGLNQFQRARWYLRNPLVSICRSLIVVPDRTFYSRCPIVAVAVSRVSDIKVRSGPNSTT